MVNFYGGQPGKDFRLAKIFNNKQEVIDDLNKGIVSSIGVGEFVIISYGDITDDEYDDNFKKDKPLEEGAPHKSYNGCFYIKDYIANPQEIDKENDIANGGWVYRFISRFTGPIPRFQETVNVSISTEDISKPKISIDPTNPDIPIMNIELPNPTATMQAIEGQQGIQVELRKMEDSNISDGLDFNFTYPKPQLFVNKVDSTVDPSASLDDNTFTFNLTLPKGVALHQVTTLEGLTGINGDLYLITGEDKKGQVYQCKNNGFDFLWDLVPSITSVVDKKFNEPISLNVDLDEENGYKLTFSFPAIPVLSVEANTLAPEAKATVQLNETDNGYKFKFGIPQGKTGNKGDTGNPMVIWDGHEPLELSGNKTELQEIKNAIQAYLNENMADNTPKTSGELLPITYIFAVQAPAEIGEDNEGEDLTSYGIETYSLEDTNEIIAGIETIGEVSGENIYYISEKTILGFFGYYTDKWNIFLAPNGGGAGNIQWQIV